MPHSTEYITKECSLLNQELQAKLEQLLEVLSEAQGNNRWGSQPHRLPEIYDALAKLMQELPSIADRYDCLMAMLSERITQSPYSEQAVLWDGILQSYYEFKKDLGSFIQSILPFLLSKEERQEPGTLFSSTLHMHQKTVLFGRVMVNT